MSDDMSRARAARTVSAAEQKRQEAARKASLSGEPDSGPYANVSLWDRQPNEGAKSWERFQIYRNMGPTRSLKRVSVETGVPTSTLSSQAMKNAWVMRAAAWDEEQDRLDQVWMRTERQKALKRHVKQAQALTNKWLERLGALDPNELSPSDVIRYAEIATKMEREALKMDDKSLNVTVAGSVETIAQMGPDETKLRIAAIQRELARRAEEATTYSPADDKQKPSEAPESSPTSDPSTDGQE